MNMINTLFAGGIIYWKRHVNGRQVSAQAESSSQNVTMISQPHGIDMEGNGANINSESTSTCLSIRPLILLRTGNGEENPSGANPELKKEDGKSPEHSSILLTDNFNSIIVDLEQEITNKLSTQVNQITKRIDEIDTKYCSMKGNLNNAEMKMAEIDIKCSSMKSVLNTAEMKIKTLDEKRILTKTEHHEYKRRLQCVEQKFSKNRVN